MAANEMVTNKLQDQIKYEEKLITLRQKTIPDSCQLKRRSDSMIENITATGILRDHTVKIRSHPGATSIDMCDYIKPELRNQPYVIILLCGKNDISNEIKTLKKLKKL